MAVTKVVTYTADGQSFNSEPEARKQDQRAAAETRLATLLSTTRQDSRIQDVLDALETDAQGAGSLGKTLLDYAQAAEEVG